MSGFTRRAIVGAAAGPWAASTRNDARAPVDRPSKRRVTTRRSVGGTWSSTPGPSARTARASSRAYIGLPPASSWSRSRTGRVACSPSAATRARISARSSGPSRTSTRLSAGTTALASGDDPSSRSVASTTTGSRSRRRNAYRSTSPDAGSSHCTSSMATTSGRRSAWRRSTSSTSRPRSNRSSSGSSAGPPSSPSRSASATNEPPLSSSPGRVIGDVVARGTVTTDGGPPERRLADPWLTADDDEPGPDAGSGFVDDRGETSELAVAPDQPPGARLHEEWSGHCAATVRSSSRRARPISSPADAIGGSACDRWSAGPASSRSGRIC